MAKDRNRNAAYAIGTGILVIALTVWALLSLETFLGALPFLVLAGILILLTWIVLRIQERSRHHKRTRTESDGDIELKKVEGDEILRGMLNRATLLGYAACAVFAWSMWDVVLLDTGSFAFNLGFPFILLAVLHLVFDGLKRVPEDKVGGLYFTGYPLANVYAGLHFAPFQRLELGSADILKIYAPGKPEEVFWKDEEDGLPTDMVRPIFLHTRAPREDEKKPLDTQMSVGVSYSVFAFIDDFLTFNAHTRTEGEMREQLISISTAILGEVIATYTVDGAIANQKKINEDLDNEIRERIKGWGVGITRANLTKINPSHALAIAMRDRAQAQFEADTEVIRAQGKAVARERLGLAEARATHDETLGPLEAKAKGLKMIAETPGALDAHTAQVGLSDKAVVIAPDMAGAIGAIKGIEKALADKGGPAA